MKIEVSTIIDVPVAGVWHFYAVDHVRNHPRWDPAMELEQISDGPIGLGTRIRRRYHRFGEAVEGEMEIVEWEPERVMGARIRDANGEIYGRVTFELVGPSRTRLALDADFPNLDAERGDQLRPMIEQSYDNIRRMVESGEQEGGTPRVGGEPGRT